MAKQNKKSNSKTSSSKRGYNEGSRSQSGSDSRIRDSKVNRKTDSTGPNTKLGKNR